MVDDCWDMGIPEMPDCMMSGLQELRVYVEGIESGCLQRRGSSGCWSAGRAVGYTEKHTANDN